jgi:cyclopropane fatty-acyl-phospholipid synthase-like methyltransferase
MIGKPYAESCDQNREPIVRVLKKYLPERHTVLEVGSGTGQHAVYFSAEFPWISWQTSDLEENHAGIHAWIKDSGLDNVLGPITLDVDGTWPDIRYDLIFSANTLHIMAESSVINLFGNVRNCMHESSVCLVYGPFNYHGAYTSPSNERFDHWLKQRDPQSGIKNFEWLQDIAGVSGLECCNDFAMPANNRMLVWRVNNTAGF